MLAIACGLGWTGYIMYAAFAGKPDSSATTFLAVFGSLLLIEIGQISRDVSKIRERLEAKK